MILTRCVVKSLVSLWILTSSCTLAFTSSHQRLNFLGSRLCSEKKKCCPLHNAKPNHNSLPDRSTPKHRIRPSKSSSSSSSTSSSSPLRKKSKKRLRKELMKAFTDDVTDDRQDIANHIAKEYSRGVKGIRAAEARRKILEQFQSEESARQRDYLKMLERHPTLVLNADYQPLNHLPLSIWTWQEAVKSVFSGKVRVVDVYPDVTIRAVNIEMALPSVIVLNDFVSHANKQRPAFTRRNVFLRDGYRCQYCNDLFRSGDLSLDHVVPRCMGGQLSWDNAVTCCKNCNGRKGRLPLSELKSVGMKLLKEPRTPTAFELASEAGKLVPRKVHPTWAPFLGEGYIAKKVEVGTKEIEEEEGVWVEEE